MSYFSYRLIECGENCNFKFVFTFTLAHLFICLFAHLFTCPHVHLCICSLVYLFISLFVDLLTCSLVEEVVYHGIFSRIMFNQRDLNNVAVTYRVCARKPTAEECTSII